MKKDYQTSTLNGAAGFDRAYNAWHEDKNPDGIREGYDNDMGDIILKRDYPCLMAEDLRYPDDWDGTWYHSCSQAYDYDEGRNCWWDCKHKERCREDKKPELFLKEEE